MKNAVWTALCAVSIGAAGAALGARAPQSPDTRSPTAKQSSSADEPTVTVTGCLRKQGEVFGTRGLLDADEVVVTNATTGHSGSKAARRRARMSMHPAVQPQAAAARRRTQRGRRPAPEATGESTTCQAAVKKRWLRSSDIA